MLNTLLHTHSLTHTILQTLDSLYYFGYHHLIWNRQAHSPGFSTHFPGDTNALHFERHWIMTTITYLVDCIHLPINSKFIYIAHFFLAIEYWLVSSHPSEHHEFTNHIDIRHFSAKIREGKKWITSVGFLRRGRIDLLWVTSLSFRFSVVPCVTEKKTETSENPSQMNIDQSSFLLLLNVWPCDSTIEESICLIWALRSQIVSNIRSFTYYILICWRETSHSE